MDARNDCLPASAVGAPHRRDRVWFVANPVRGGCEERPVSEGETRAAVSDAAGRGGRCADVADAETSGTLRRRRFANDDRADDGFIFRRAEFDDFRQWWAIEPDVGRVAARVPARVDRLRGLGNAIVPQIAEWIAHRILDAEELICIA